MAIKCRIWWDVNTEAYLVNCSYSDKFVETLKQFIPSGERDWDPGTKTWYIKEKYGAFVRQMAENAFGIPSVSFTSKDVASQSQQFRQQYYQPPRGIVQGTGTTEDAVVQFFGLIPYEVAKKCYLLAAQTLHPDKPSGDGAKMIKLNELWQRLEKEFYKR